MADRIITSTRSWSSHVAMDHGRKNVPKLRTVPQPTLDETKQDTDLSLAYSDMEENLPVEISSAASESNKTAICLLCRDRPSFNFKSNLTAHCKTKHVKTGRFNKAFPCPECCRRGNPDHLITTPSSWSSHVELAHGRANAPTLRTEPAPPKTMLCPFYGRFSSGKHRSGHVRDGPASSIFSKPFPCQACRNDSQPGGSNQDVMIDGCSAWNAHVFAAHGKNSRAWTVEIKPVGIKRRWEGGNTKRDSIQCLLCDGFFPLRGIWVHFMRTHLPVLASGSVACLECSGRHRGEEEPTSRIIGFGAWNKHLQSTHCDLFWYFTASRSSFAVAEPPPRTQTNTVGGTKRRKIERTGIEAVTPGGCSVSSISAIHGDDEWREIPRDNFNTDTQSTPSLEQSSIDLSVVDPILSDWSDRTLWHSTATPESPDEPHTPVPCEGIDINLIDPRLWNEEDKESSNMKPR